MANAENNVWMDLIERPPDGQMTPRPIRRFRGEMRHQVADIPNLKKEEPAPHQSFWHRLPLLRIVLGVAAFLATAGILTQAWFGRQMPLPVETSARQAPPIAGVPSRIHIPSGRPSDDSVRQLREANPRAIPSRRMPDPVAPPLSRAAYQPPAIRAPQSQSVPRNPDGSLPNLNKNVIAGPANKFHLLNNFIPAPKFGNAATQLGLGKHQPQALRIKGPVPNRQQRPTTPLNVHAPSHASLPNLAARQNASTGIDKRGTVEPLGAGAPDLTSRTISDRAERQFIQEPSLIFGPEGLMVLSMFMLLGGAAWLAAAKFRGKWSALNVAIGATPILGGVAIMLIGNLSETQNGYTSAFSRMAENHVSGNVLPNPRRPSEGFFRRSAALILGPAYGNESSEALTRTLGTFFARRPINVNRPIYNAPANKPTWGPDGVGKGLGLKIMGDSGIFGNGGRSFGRGFSHYAATSGPNRSLGSGALPLGRPASSVRNAFPTKGPGASAASGRISTVGTAASKGGSQGAGQISAGPAFAGAAGPAVDNSPSPISSPAGPALDAGGLLGQDKKNSAQSQSGTTGKINSGGLGGGSFGTTANDAMVDLAHSDALPGAVNAGETFSVIVTMLNTGRNAWTANSNYLLGSKDSTQGIWGASRIRLDPGESIGPGEEKKFDLTVTAPTTPGSYNFGWQMALDNGSKLTWFGDVAYGTQSISVDGAQ